MAFFDEKTNSRRHFGASRALFCRRDSFSSLLLGEESTILPTRLVLVATYERGEHYFADETRSRRHFWVRRALFCRRDSFSSLLLGEESTILPTKPNLVAIFGRRMLLFGDEIRMGTYVFTTPPTSTSNGS